MKNLGDCLGKVVGKLINKEDADALVRESYALETRGLTSIEAERQAVRNALDQVTATGEAVLAQVRAQRPQAYQQALNFWEKETIRKAGMVPPPLPRFVTESREVPAQPAAPEAPTRAPEPTVAAAPEPTAAPEPAPAIPTTPDTVAGPIGDAAQDIVNSLPPEQRAAAQRAFARDDRDPLADSQRRNGQPVSKRKEAAIAPEKNTKLIAELSKYDFGKTVHETLKAFAGDPKQPRWVRLIADLFTQLGLGENVSIRAVNNPNASWGALYVFNRETGKGEVLINMTAKGPDLARRVLHELAHHGTLVKLDSQREGDLTAGELAAKRELEKIFEYVRANKEAFGPLATQFGSASQLTEFVSEIFANPQLRNRLNTIKPDGKVSLWQRFSDTVMRLLLGDRAAIMRPGSMLGNAIREAINVAGSPSVQTSPGAIAAMHERGARAAQAANENPNFQEEIANIVAPMANNMGISETDQIEDDLDHESAFYADTERKAVEADVDRMAQKIDATKAEIKDVKERIGAYVKYYRAKHPAKTGWANSAIKALGLDEKKGLTRGNVNKSNPSGINFKIKFEKTPYTFARNAAKKLIPRFLKDKETKQQIDNPEWAKRRQELGDKMFDDLQGIMARRNEGGEKGRVAKVILDQINWYRDMRDHLRVTFGSMSDYVADVIAGFSPITDVPGNWANFVDYFEGVMKGHYDDLYRKFDAYVAEDPKNRNASTWRDAGGELPLKLKNKAKFGTNGPNAMMAGLDMWRAIQSGTAPKARNFGLNLIGLSFRATIDRWAGRYLQRMHAPTWRLPPMIEADVKGEHMPGENVDLVSGDFGMGQDVFADVATRLQESGIPEFQNVTAADLQAILWFAEKEIWEIRKWTQIMGAGSSMNEVAKATAAQRYETGTKPGASAKDKALMSETIGLRDKLNAEQHVLGAKMVPSVNVYNGKQSKTFDGDLITHPEYDPDNMIGHVAEAAARLGKGAAHISRVIVNHYEVNDQITPGLHIFFRERVGDAEIKGVLAKLKEAGITSGITLSVDPRVRPEIVKSLDPETGANPYNGVRVQHIPGYDEAARGMTRSQIEQAFADVKVALADDANIAESRVLYYDTLVLEKGTDYDSSGKLTKNFSDGRGKAWTGRARSEGAAATTRRDDVREANKDRKRRDKELELRIEREEQERIARFEEFQRRVQPADSAIDGGVDPPAVAAMQYEDEQEPTRDPHGGRASMVRSMVNRITNLGRVPAGREIQAQPGQEVRGLAGLGGSTNQGGEGIGSVWRPLGESFRKREAELSRRVVDTAKLTETENPSGGKYARSQKLFNYLTGKESPQDLDLRDRVMELRREIPTVPRSAFTKLRGIDVGAEAEVYHDPEDGLVYKLYRISDGQFGGQMPGQLRLRSDGEIGVAVGGHSDLRQLMERMERTNSHGGLTPTELTAVTPEGDVVFAQPFVAGREVTQKNLRSALARAGIHPLSEMGGVAGVAKLDDGRWVLYDDLHPGNVRTLPGGRVEIVDALNRELDQYEIDDLTKLGKMPLEKLPGTPSRAQPKTSQKYDNALVVAPMVETHHGTPHEWEPEVKVRFDDGSEQWVRQSSIDKVGGLKGGQKIIERAPAGRVRKEFVGTGESNAAFGWGVLYSAQSFGLADEYRRTLSSGRGQWLVDNEPAERFIGDLTSEEIMNFRDALVSTDPDITIDEQVLDLRAEANRRLDAAKRRSPHDPELSKHHGTAQRYNQRADILEKLKHRLTYIREEGNVYTVQLDVEDPELLDWFMPMKDQMWVFDKVAERFGVTQESAREAWEENDQLAEESERLGFDDDTPDEEVTAAEERWSRHYKQMATQLGGVLRSIEKKGDYGAKPYTGEAFYKFLTDRLNTQQAASEYLELSGVPGIVFLDRKSRGKAKLGKWQVVRPDGQVHSYFDSKEAAERFLTGSTGTLAALGEALPPGWKVVEGEKLTNNYVMFDPELIKVVAKNGEVVRTVADDLPAQPEPVVEPVTVAAMQEEDVKDNTDLSVAPMAARGSKARMSWLPVPRSEVPGYEAGGIKGWFTAHKGLNKNVARFVNEHKQRLKSVAARAELITKELQGELKAAYGKAGPDKLQQKDIQVALGNMDNRLDKAQFQQALKIKDLKAREQFVDAIHKQNVADFKVRQQAAIASLPDNVRDKIRELRDELEMQTRELAKDPGLKPDLKARIDNEMGVFLHSNAFQHFENDVWGDYINKSGDPEAVRIRLAAENLFRNEVVAEKALKYQQDNPGTSDADALAFANALPNIGDLAKIRLKDYMDKSSDEVTRVHLLQGKMPVYDSENKKLLSLNRENIPDEVKELWGQWNDPTVNFVKTYTLLANHNADVRMQTAIALDGATAGYISDTNAPNLVPLGKQGDRGPLGGKYGPQILKDGLTLYHSPPVQDMLAKFNRWALASKTVGNIATGIKNFFGNPMFLVTNGNAFWAATHMPVGVFGEMVKSLDISFRREAKGVHRAGLEAKRDEISELIDLGVFDSDVATNTIKGIYETAQVSAELEKKMGMGLGIHGAMKMMAKKSAQEAWGGLKGFYTMADNFWKYFNYKIELSKQQWIHEGSATPPSLEEMKRKAAERTLDTMPSYSRVPAAVSEVLGPTGLGKFGAPFITFQTEMLRTISNNAFLAWNDSVHGVNAREKSLAAYRMAGIVTAAGLPWALGMLAKAMFKYDDDDEEALRASLPEYQRNSSMLIMLPRDKDGKPRYFDASWVNPYGLIHNMGIAGARALKSGAGLAQSAGTAAWSLVKPVFSIQLGVATMVEVASNDYFRRGGSPIYNPQDSWDNQAKAVAKHIWDNLGPGTMVNAGKAAISAVHTLRGTKDERTGKEPDFVQDVTYGLMGMPRFSTMDWDQATKSAVGTYEKEMRQAKSLVNQKVSAKGTVESGEITEAYEQANEQAFEIFKEMHAAYKNMIKMGMRKPAAVTMMQIGGGSTVRKSGLSKDDIRDVTSGVFTPIEISKLAEKELQKKDPKLLREYKAVRRQAKKRRIER